MVWPVSEMRCQASLPCGSRTERAGASHALFLLWLALLLPNSAPIAWEQQSQLENHLITAACGLLHVHASWWKDRPGSLRLRGGFAGVLQSKDQEKEHGGPMAPGGQRNKWNRPPSRAAAAGGRLEGLCPNQTGNLGINGTADLIRQAQEQEQKMLAEETRMLEDRHTKRARSVGDRGEEFDQEPDLTKKLKMEHAPAWSDTSALQSYTVSKTLAEQSPNASHLDAATQLLFQQALHEEMQLLAEEAKEAVEIEAQAHSNDHALGVPVGTHGGAVISERTRRLLLQAHNEEMYMLELEASSQRAGRQGGQGRGRHVHESETSDIKPDTGSLARPGILKKLPTPSNAPPPNLRPERSPTKANTGMRQVGDPGDVAKANAYTAAAPAARIQTRVAPLAPAAAATGTGASRCADREEGARVDESALGVLETSRAASPMLATLRVPSPMLAPLGVRSPTIAITGCGLCTGGAEWVDWGQGRGTVEAWCLTCEEPLCRLCVAMHRSVKLFANHSLQPFVLTN